MSSQDVDYNEYTEEFDNYLESNGYYSEDDGQLKNEDGKIVSESLYNDMLVEYVDEKLHDDVYLYGEFMDDPD